MSKLYYTRKTAGLCVDCGDASRAGKTRCTACAKIANVKAQMYRDSLTPAEKRMKYDHVRAWREAHPEKIAEYKRRKQEYNRKYMEGA